MLGGCKALTLGTKRSIPIVMNDQQSLGHPTARRSVWKILPKPQTGFGKKEIGGAINEGAITKQYLADPLTIVSSLNRIRSTQITSYLQYKQPAYMAVSLLSPGLKTEFEAHALQELQHADTLANRIQQLGGVPVFDLKELAGKAASIRVQPEQGTTLNEMVSENLMLERLQVEPSNMEDCR